MQLIKIFVTSILLTFYLHSSTFNLKSIQDNFHNKVVLEPIYSKKYSTYLNFVCKNKDKACSTLKVKKLISNQNPLKNTVIKNTIKKRELKFIVDDAYWKKAQVHLKAIRDKLFSSQFVTLIDLSKQVLIVVLFDIKKEIFHPIGFDFISSGNMEKEMQVINGEDHYLKTPTGLFSVRSGWRSKGETLNDKITMPYGKKDRFVFYFGKQRSIRYNVLDGNGTKVEDKSKWQLITDELEFAIHAHQSALSLGEPHSHGCVRMSNELNKFLDNNMVFFKYFYNKENKWLHPFAKPPSEPKSHDLAGEYMLIVDEI